MKATKDFPYSRAAPMLAERSVWIVLIVSSGVCLSPFFACVTPFAALATLSALKLNWRDAVVAMGLVWLTNQAIGYGLLGYPWTLDSLAWGLAIGASASLAILAARALFATRPGPLAISLPFVAAFAVFELSLYIDGCVLPGSAGGFTASVVWQVFLVNVVTLCCLMAVYRLARILGLLIRNDEPDLLSLGRAS